MIPNINIPDTSILTCAFSEFPYSDVYSTSHAELLSTRSGHKELASKTASSRPSRTSGCSLFLNTNYTGRIDDDFEVSCKHRRNLSSKHDKRMSRKEDHFA